MKNKNKKKRSLIHGFAAIAVLFVLAVLLTQQNISAHHTDADSCEPASGVTQPILDPKYGVADAGTLDFDIIEKKGWHNSRACVRKVAKQFEGWAWNTNWGYVNFKCGDYGGVSLTSIDGVPCGTIKYASGVAELPDKSLSLVGYAWADNIGWISLACRDFDSDGFLENYRYGEIQSANKVSCGEIEYGISVDGETGNLSGYGYTNTVGWMKGDGAKVPAMKARLVSVDPKTGVENPPAIPPGSDIVTPDPTAGGSVSISDPNYNTIYSEIRTSDNKVYANGADAHLINVKVKRGDDVLGCGDASVSITTDFSEDVDFDQINDNPLDPLTRETGGEGPVSSLLDGTSYPLTNSQFKCDPVTGVRTAKITSLAPTNALNTLTLNSITVSAQDLLPNVITFSPPRSLDFSSAIDIDEIKSQDPQSGWQNKLFGTANASNEIQATVSRKISGGTIPANNTVFIEGQFTPTDPSNVYEFWFDKGCNGPDTTETVNPDNTITKQITPTDDALGINSSLIKNLYAQDFLGAGSSRAVPTALTRLGCLYTYLPPNVSTPEFEKIDIVKLEPYIRYNVLGKPVPVKYKTKSLQAGSVMNQFAMVTGGTAVGEFQELVKVQVDTGLIDPITGEPIYELQGVVSNIGKRVVGIPDKDRWTLVKRFAPYLRRTNLPLEIFNTGVAPTTPPIEINEAVFSTATLKNRNILYYKKQRGGTEPFKLVLTNPNRDSVTNEVYPIDNIGAPKTIICEGCDMYIDKDIIGNAKIGLIILKDPSITNQARQGGNVYLCNSVTETNLSIFADGSLYSYGGEDGNGVFAPLGDSKVSRGDTTSCKKVHNPDGTKVIGAIDPDGLPYYGPKDDIATLATMKQLLKNQYTNYGVLQIKNTLGGFAKTPPKTAEGETNNAWKARLQDLNYLRSAEVDPRKVNVDVSVRPVKQGVLWSEKTEVSLSLGDRGEAWDPNPESLTPDPEEVTDNHPPKVGIVNFIGTDIRNIPILGFK